MKRIRQALIVDDARFMRYLLREILEPYAGMIAEAGTLSEAVSHARETQPELITLDLTLDANEMVQGLEALDRLRQVSPESRIVVVSALDQQWLRNETAARGAADYIKKPFATDEIRRQIEVLTEV